MTTTKLNDTQLQTTATRIIEKDAILEDLKLAEAEKVFVENRIKQLNDLLKLFE